MSDCKLLYLSDQRYNSFHVSIIILHADVSIETEQLVAEELREITDWNKLGVHLGVPDPVRREIELQFSPVHGPGRCRSELISKWWRRSPNANWGDVIGALKKMEENRLAAHLEERYQKTVTNLRSGQGIYAN